MHTTPGISQRHWRVAPSFTFPRAPPRRGVEPTTTLHRDLRRHRRLRPRIRRHRIRAPPSRPIRRYPRSSWAPSSGRSSASDTCRWCLRTRVATTTGRPPIYPWMGRTETYRAGTAPRTRTRSPPTAPPPTPTDERRAAEEIGARRAESIEADTDEANLGDLESVLLHHIGKVAEILFFLIGAMTIVELVDPPQGLRRDHQSDHDQQEEELAAAHLHPGVLPLGHARQPRCDHCAGEPPAQARADARRATVVRVTGRHRRQCRRGLESHRRRHHDDAVDRGQSHHHGAHLPPRAPVPGLHRRPRRHRLFPAGLPGQRHRAGPRRGRR